MIGSNLQSQKEEYSSSLDSNSLIIIDASLSNYQSLIPDGNSSSVVLLDSTQNGIQQITETLQNYQNLSSIHILSHGESGLLQFGNVVLNSDSFAQYQADIASWGQALSATGDMLFYGCDFGSDEAGVELANRIAEVTDADVAVSNDLTGSLKLGGDWDLELNFGEVEAKALALSDYDGVLAFSQYDLASGKVADFNGDGLADLFRQEKGSWDDDYHLTAQVMLSEGNGFANHHLPEQFNLKGDFTNVYLGDFNGDGKTDFLRQEKGYWDDDDSGTAQLYISNGDATFSEIALPENWELDGDFNNLYVGDFNGDGRSDVFRQMKMAWDNNASEYTGVLFLSNAQTGYVSMQTLPAALMLQGDYTDISLGDFNGDGRTDLLRQEKSDFDNNGANDAHVLYSTGNGFSAVPLFSDKSLHADVSNLYVGDFNGDGRDDILHQSEGHLDNDWNASETLLTSTGNGFIGYATDRNLWIKGDYTNLFVGDFNGDGRDDLLRQEKGHWDNDHSGTASILYSWGDGRNFNRVDLSETLKLHGDLTNLMVGDFSGDGRSDIIRQEKSWLGYGDSMSEQLTSTGNGFLKTSISDTNWLNGNLTNVIANNQNARYLSSLEDDGLKFNFTYDSNVNWHQKNSFELAGQMWSNYLTDDVTVNIHVSMAHNSDLPDNTLGGAVPFFVQDTWYTNFRQGLMNDRDRHIAAVSGNNDDQLAINSLENSNSYSVTTPEQNGVGLTRQYNKVAMTRANAKALGFINGDDRTLDGTIVMNSLVGTGASWNYNYDSSSQVGADKIDFTTVAIHEIGHTLGFVSAIDALDSSNYLSWDAINDGITALDLFRYDWSGGAPRRSIRTRESAIAVNGGYNKIRYTSNGVSNLGGDTDADGFQGSHWRDNSGAIMAPLLSTNERRQITEADLRALDIIGWDRKHTESSWRVELDEAKNKADNKGWKNRNMEVEDMIDDWRWAGRRRKTRLGQQGNIALFLAQEGFFNVGAFRESFDFSSLKTSNQELPNWSAFTSDLLDSLDEIVAKSDRSLDESLLTNLSPDGLEGILADAAKLSIEFNSNVISLEEWLGDLEAKNLNLEDLEALLQEELAQSV